MVVGLRDQYGLHAYLTALENAGLQARLDTEIKAGVRTGRETNERLIQILQTGKLAAEPPAVQEKVLVKAASQS
jgi:hypothetical protein